MSLARGNDQLETVRALGGWIEQENIGRFLATTFKRTRKQERTAMLADKIFLWELNSVLFSQIRHIIAVIDHAIEIRAKFPCTGISLICLGFYN